MARKRDVAALMTFLGGLAVVAAVIKFLSPGHKCKKCDQVISLVNAIQGLCPFCGVIA
jgi:Zn finger protein HypA/HybF involved in hydrogenase expression